jgi:4-amino-4-deoxy-L-arabinose transferase-like glycosyltransferase
MFKQPNFVVFALVAFLSFFYQIHAVPLFDVDEGAFSQATREMFLRGDFLSTYLNNQPRHDKPIFIYWLQALSVASFGVNEFAFRLPSALAATLWMLAIFVLTRRILDNKTAWLATLFAATSLEIATIGKAATADATLNLCITASMLSLYHFLHSQQPKFLYFSAFWSGIGFLTKGPIALVIPAIVSLLHCGIAGRWRVWRKMATNLTAWGVFATVALPWYGVQYLRQGSEFIENFFLHHNVARFQQGLEGHTGAFWYYLPILLLGVLPYSIALIYTLLQFKQLIKNEFARYLLLWFGFVFIFFSLSATKLPHYIIYGYTPLFILMAIYFAQESQPSRSHWLLLPARLFLLLLLALPQLLALSLPHIQDVFVQAMLENPLQYFSPLYYGTVAIGLFYLIYLGWTSTLTNSSKLILSGIIINFILVTFILPIVATVQQQPIKQAALISQQFSEDVVLWRLHTPSFSVYRGKIAERRDPRVGELVLTKTHFLTELKHYQVIYQQNGVTLAKVLAVK